MKDYPLSGEGWRVKAMHPYVPFQGNSMETGVELKGITPWIPCRVPGGVALALFRAGYIEHPYFEMNSLKCEWIENKWWVYEKSFKRPNLKGKRFRLVFRGVDYYAYVYLNDVLLGEHEGMFDAFSYDITDIFKANEAFTLKVLIRHAPDEMGQIGKTSETFTQKSRFNYKWDFGTRLVNLGIWQPVSIVAEDSCGLDDIYLHSDLNEGGDGVLSLYGSICGMSEGLQIGLHVSLGGEEKYSGTILPENGIFTTEILLPQPELWWPNGAGEHPLYDVKISLLDSDGRFLDERLYQQGIRRLRYLQNEDSPEDAFPYTFEVNGRKIYIKGVNMTPLDHIYGDIPTEQYEQTLQAAVNMNVNLIRVWGGGIIETEEFYSICDRLGLMVWQEFIQSSSGIDNIPSKRPEFLFLLEKTARCAVKQKRSHTSLTVWSGGNELMDKDGIPSTLKDENLAMLKQIVNDLDPSRMFLPTSASGPTEWQLKESGKSHDIHGDWQYRGNPHHYESYLNADNLFHSEFGCDGMTDRKAVRKILSSPRQKPMAVVNDDVWRFHGDWWCTYEREKKMFGRIDGLDSYVDASQWIQAEGLRFILESNRRRMFRNSGSIIWQFNEPWPNVSCTCLYSYYGEPKMAYYWANDAYRSLHASLTYKKLDYLPDETFKGEVWLTADDWITAKQVPVICEAFTVSGESLFRAAEEVTIIPGKSLLCFPVKFSAPSQGQLFLVRLSIRGEDDETTYIFSTDNQHVYAPALSLPAPELSSALLSEDGSCLTYRVTNTGKVAALHVHFEDDSDRSNLLADKSYFALLPGESRLISLRCTPKFQFGFDEYAGHDTAIPDLKLHTFIMK